MAINNNASNRTNVSHLNAAEGSAEASASVAVTVEAVGNSAEEMQTNTLQPPSFSLNTETSTFSIEEASLNSRTDSFKTWIEQHLDKIAEESLFLFNSLSGAYQALNPILILQCKIGSASVVGSLGASPVNIWAQHGFQINVIFRGINFLEKRPIMQFFLHNEMGLACEAAGMSILNTGLCFEPGSDERYHFSNISFMTEEVHRVEYGGAMAQRSSEGIKMSFNGSVGLDVLEHNYWKGSKKKWIAGALVTAAQTSGSVAGWLAGSFFESAAAPLAALEQAIIPTASVSSTFSPFTSPAPSPVTSPVYQWADLGASFGGVLAAKGMLGFIKSTSSLAPKKTLSMSEVTFSATECAFEMPLGIGETLYIMAFLRCNLTGITENTPSYIPVLPNPRFTPYAPQTSEENTNVGLENELESQSENQEEEETIY